MTKPVRIQRKRTKGWKMPPDTVYVGRPGRFGNPFRVGQHGDDAGICTALFKRWINGDLSNDEILERWSRPWADWFINMRQERKQDVASLRGKNLACWCPLDQPCHADVLLELANATPEASE